MKSLIGFVTVTIHFFYCEGYLIIVGCKLFFQPSGAYPLTFPCQKETSCLGATSAPSPSDTIVPLVPTLVPEGPVVPGGVPWVPWRRVLGWLCHASVPSLFYTRPCAAVARPSGAHPRPPRRFHHALRSGSQAPIQPRWDHIVGVCNLVVCRGWFGA